MAARESFCHGIILIAIQCQLDKNETAYRGVQDAGWLGKEPQSIYDVQTDDEGGGTKYTKVVDNPSGKPTAAYGQIRFYGFGKQKLNQ